MKEMFEQILTKYLQIYIEYMYVIWCKQCVSVKETDFFSTVEKIQEMT